MPDKDIVLATLVLYKIVLIGVGLWARRRVNPEQDFFLAGKQPGPRANHCW